MVLVHQVGSKRGAAAATAFALVGVFVLGFAAALWYRDATATLPDVALTGPLAPPEQPLPESLGELRALHLELAATDLQAIQRLRDRSLAEGFVVTDETSYFPARVTLDGVTAEAQVRLKGDFTDHIDSGKWSFRIEVQGGATLGGMSRFSIQHPKTRGFLMEWVVMEAARREGLLAPRTDFVAVRINGSPSGAYYLEEHFTKEMLESQGRRDGPIVRFLEDSFWSALRQHDARDMGVPQAAAESGYLENAEIGAFGEARLRKDKAMERRLQRALDQLRTVQWRLAESRGQPAEALAARVALENARARALDEIFAGEAVGRMLAIYSWFRCVHGLAWHQFRFYHDPVRDRLEPVVFDTGADLAGESPLLAVELPELEPLFSSDTVFEEAYASMARIGSREYLEQFLTAIAPDLRRYARVLHDEGLLPSALDPLVALRTVLGVQGARLQRVAQPADPANFFAFAENVADKPVVRVEGWTTTTAPVRVRGFRFSNGRFVTAAAVATDAPARRRPGGEVALPRDGRRLQFVVPLDQRLWALRDIQAIKDAIRTQAGADQGVNVQVEVEFGAVGSAAPLSEPLSIHRRTSLQGVVGRPAPVSLRDVLEAHPFLSWDLVEDRLQTRPGTHAVAGDLILPEGMELVVNAGTVLQFAPAAVLLATGPLTVRGTAAAPVVFEPRAGAAKFAGIVVMDSAGPSLWSHAVVRRADALARGGWQTTGGVSFYHSACEFRNCRFEDAPGEDSLNVFGCAITIEDCEFSGGASDLFDGDFVHGTVRRTRFDGAVEDALDFSGSDVVVEDCEFEVVGDKALSIGERTRARIRHCRVRRAAIALAVKDRSEVEVSDFAVEAVEHWHVAVFVKKSEFGPATVKASNLRLGTSGRGDYLVQNGCSLSVDGAAVATQAVDVAGLYKQRILGK